MVRLKDIYIIIYLFAFILVPKIQAFSQDSQFSNNIIETITANSESGVLNIVEDSSIYNLLIRDIEISQKIAGIPDGYRIQIFSISGKSARDEMEIAKKKFIELYPDFDQSEIYTEYHPPFFKIRIGNYRDKFEAFKIYKNVVKSFPNAYLVKGKIEFPKVD